MPLNYNDIAFSIFHPIIVVFIAFVIGMLLLEHPIKRTIGFIASSMCLSIILAYIFDNFTGSNPISSPFQYLIPVIINTIIAIIFLYLDSPQESKTYQLDKNSRIEEHDNLNISITEKNSSNTLIEQYFNNPSFIKTEYENTVISNNGVIIFYQKQNLTSFVTLNVDLFSYLVYPQTTDKSNGHLIEDILIELNKYNSSIRRMELTPIIYYPQKIYNKYNDIILNKYAKRVISDQSDENVITTIKEKASIMTFIKNQSLTSLPNEWVIIKLHHHFETHFDTQFYSSNCQILLDELLITFESNIAVFQQSFPDFKRLYALTEFSRDSLILLHKYDIPPLYLLVPLDDNLIDHLVQRNLVQREVNTTRENQDNQSIIQDHVHHQDTNETEEFDNNTLISDNTVNNVNNN